MEGEKEEKEMCKNTKTVWFALSLCLSVFSGSRLSQTPRCVTLWVPPSVENDEVVSRVAVAVTLTHCW